MASLKVAVRVRPFNQRELDMNAKLIVQMDGKKTRLHSLKGPTSQNQPSDVSRDRYKDFTFDHSYWSYDTNDNHFASQEQVFSDLGIDVIDSAFEGYNACVFAYGQTGSGKTFTMMGSPECQGLIPRICRSLFSRVAAGKENGASYRTEVSYLEIYNERVKDLLGGETGHSLKVREHPRLGPYVQDLSKHLVSDYDDIQECMHRGNLHRTTASTQMNDVSSRSHAIFTITFVQAVFLQHNNMPSETVSKVHLVDLAGSERADATGATGQRLIEGAHINKSLVTLGSVISALAESSLMQNNVAPQQKNGKNSKNVFIPYRDSVLTWLLKDSLGGNSKTIMIAAISPADCNYGETLSTLRYANRAKNIINKPTINEDPNVKLIRELREEIDKLRSQIGPHNHSIDNEPQVLATLQRKEAQEKVLTEKWTEKWRETQQILQEQKALGLRKSGLGVVLDSDMPHLVGIDDNLLSTGVTLYHLKEGETLIGSEECEAVPDIILTGGGVLSEHCRISLHDGVATIYPNQNAQCWLNTVLIDKPAKLSQGCILLLGRTNMFRYNDPAEAAKLRKEGSTSMMNLSRLSLLSWSTTDLAASTENLASVVGDIETDIRADEIEAQRLELIREREVFQQEQEERERQWHMEKEQLQEAQKRLDSERQQMEKEYASQCRQLTSDWQALERGWGAGQQALKERQTELSGRQKKLLSLKENHQQMVDCEFSHASTVKREIELKRKTLEQLIVDKLKQLKQKGIDVPANIIPSADNPLTDSSAEGLLQLLQQYDSEAALAMRDLVNHHKKELSSLEQELQTRIASLSSHRSKVHQLESELSLLALQEAGIQQTLLDNQDGQALSDEEDSKVSPNSTLENEGGDKEDLRERKKSMTLDLKLAQLSSSTLTTCDTFHTANSSCSLETTTNDLISLPSDSNLNSSSTNVDTSTPYDSNKMASSGYVNGKIPSIMTDSGIVESTPITSSPPKLKNKNLPSLDDSDEMSSTEDYNKGKKNNMLIQSPGFSDKISPEDRHSRAKLRRKLAGDMGRGTSGSKHITEGEALRAMQRLCQKVAAQKMLVISSLENDCSKEELNHQIAVLQELQRKYVRLEMALQYSNFDNRSNSRSRSIMVTPIHETPYGGSDGETTDNLLSDEGLTDDTFNEGSYSTGRVTTLRVVTTDPLQQRLKDEIEGSDNVSTSNDELITSESEVYDNNTWSVNEESPLQDVKISTDSISNVHGDSVLGSRMNLFDLHILNRTNDNITATPYDNSNWLLHSDVLNQCISVPCFVIRGAGKSTHYEYEVRIDLEEERWALLRRYRRFRELYINMKILYGAKVAAISFPPRQLWSSESLAGSRRPQLEKFLRTLIKTCASDKRCPFHAQPLTKETLVQFSPFFRKGVFESGKCGTG
ncbi:kinesin-like protein 98A [Arctopsyche grandis]|uniref:kinesin-like protein 98A n=1 Tax=Arctopsyche grandis TaxID=121162 RepID=UPI00406D6CD9